MSTQESWRMDPDGAWRLYLAALTGEAELAAEMRAQRMSWGADLAEDAEGLRPVLLREVSAAQTEPGITQRRATAEPGRNVEILGRVRTRQTCPPVGD